MEDLATAVEMRDVEADDLGHDAFERLDPGLVRAVGVAREKRLVVEADQVAALGLGGCVEPSRDRDAGRREIALERRRLAAPALLARAQQDDALLRHQRGVECIDIVEVAAIDRRREHDLRAGLLEQGAEVLVLLPQAHGIGLGAPAAAAPGADVLLRRSHEDAPQRSGHVPAAEERGGWSFHVAEPSATLCA